MRQFTSVLITGASGGIGAALARAYAGPGTTLALTGRNPDRLKAVVGTAEAAGATVLAKILDVRDGGALATWVAEVDGVRPLDLVIANAGITGGHRNRESEESLDDVRRIMAINFMGACATAGAAAIAMRPRRRGRIALVSSIAGLRGMPYSPGYCASKAALIAYAEALRGRLRHDGIAVSLILPGFVDTPMAARVDGPKPLMMGPDRAARIVVRGLARGRSRIAFPLPLYLGQRALALLPAAPVDFLFNRFHVSISASE